MRTVLALFAVALATLAAALASATAAPLPSRERLLEDHTQFLALARDGLVTTRERWWNDELGWYNDRLDTTWNRSMPLARLWSAFPLFNAYNAVAIAQPTAANRAAVRWFARYARRYWNPTLKPVGGFAYYFDTRKPNIHTYFDDNGWWAIAFLDAFRATGDRAYLADAARAFRYIAVSGWDSLGNGGVWWENRYLHKTSEPLAAAIYAGAVLYRETKNPYYLRQADKLLAWADEYSWDFKRKLYGRSDTDNTVMSYVEGMMIGAHIELCRLGRKALCAKAVALAEASTRVFVRDWNPNADAIYLRFMLDLYRQTGDERWYTLVYETAKRALVNGRSQSGLFLRRWDGRPMPRGYLQTQAATLSLFAWMATVEPPGN